ncbi:transposase [Actinomadura sp. KC216]|uniref:RNA-guided endonuclease InsQ/TnpB family protein n=1 Tax=Actinomadura sp. KC216 TaxID=2530370 RepID=UPI001FB58B31|nr:transposase [Actinomadura sp. KC216]
MLTGRKYRAYLDVWQADYAEQIGAVCRAVWNTALEQRRSYRRRGAFIGYRNQARELAEAKVEHPWLRTVPAHCLQQTLMDLDRACRTYSPWKVNWRARVGRHFWSPSFRFPDGKRIRVKRIGRKWGLAKLPKMGWIRFRWSRPLGGTIRSATLKRDGSQWHISFLVETGEPERSVSLERGRVGIDRGIVQAVATSDGRFFDRAFLTPGERQRLLRLERQCHRCRPGSRRREAVKAKIRTIRRRERDRRADFCGQTAATVVRGNALVVLEALNTRGMTASAKGTMEQPGTNVAAKSALNRKILDKGWRMFELACRNKARHAGTAVLTVNPAYTSQTCPNSGCGHVHPDNRKSQAKFVCTACGHHEHADTVGAKNVLARGHSGHRAWRPRDAPVCEAPTSGNPQGITAPGPRPRNPRL